MRLNNTKSIIVTGGCGFIGSHFIESLSKIYPHITIYNVDNFSYASSDYINKLLDKNNYKFLREDICNASIVDSIINEINPDLIFHFAAESHVDNSIENPLNFINTNIVGTYNLLNSLVKKNSVDKKAIFHHVSTDEVYGSLNLNDESFSENSKYSPNSPYSASKASSDLLVRAWHKTYNLPYIITNCSNNFGPRQHYEKLIPKIIHNALNKTKIPIYGDGSNIRDWLFVEDHIDALLKIHEADLINESFNIGGGIEINNLEMTSMILDILEKKFNFDNLHSLIEFVDDRKGHDFRYSIDSSTIQRLTKWRPSNNFTENLDKTVSYFVQENDHTNRKK